MKILFYHANNPVPQSLFKGTQLYMSITHLYLKTYLELNKPEIAKDIEWCLPLQLRLSDEELVSIIEKEKPDLFCITHYIWNTEFLQEQLPRIKSKVSSDILFVSGGPSIDVNINPNFFKENEYIDYAFYGAGEQGFAEFVERRMTGKKLNPFELSNIAWREENIAEPIIAGYKYVPQLKISPFTHNAEIFEQMVKQMQSLGYHPVIPYELTRGCPYACTFCDWNSGFTNKTTRRKESYKEEIDLFQQVGVKHIYFADANIGQYAEDLDMIDYMAQKNIQEGAGFVIDGNFSKLRKDNNLKIYHMMGKSDMCFHFVISVQDINPVILENIDRPDVGWDEHTRIINELTANYPDKPANIQLIQGLPGQTVESWRKTLKEVTDTQNITLIIFVNELLSASPAARNQEYIDKWKIKYSKAKRWDEVRKVEFRGNFSMESTTYTRENYVEMAMLSAIYSAIALFRNNTPVKVHFDKEAVVETFLQSKQYEMLKENLYTNWVENDRYYWTIDFNGKITKDPMSGCHLSGIVANDWSINTTFLSWVANNLLSDTHSKSQYVREILKFRKDGNTVWV